MVNLIKIFLAVAILGGAALYFFQNPPQFISKIPSGERTSIFGDFFAPSKMSAPSSASYSQISGSQSAGKQDIPDSQIPVGFSRSDLSLYFQEVKVNSVSAYSLTNGEKSVTIRMNYSVPQGKAVDVTGWKIKSNKGEIFLPRAVKVYEPNALNNEENIVFSGNGYATLYKGKSPIGKSFRLNKCTGYLQKQYNFNPSLPLNCPRPDRSETVGFSGQCQSYIMSLGSCSLPDLNIYNSFPGTDQGNECRTFLSKITFNSCFQKHQGDSDFLSSEWRIWMEFGDNVFDGQHDRILLFDNQGLLVSQYIY